MAQSSRTCKMVVSCNDKDNSGIGAFQCLFFDQKSLNFGHGKQSKLQWRMPREKKLMENKASCPEMLPIRSIILNLEGENEMYQVWN